MSYDQKPFPESPKIGYIDPITPLNRIYSKGSLGSPNGGLVLRSPVYRGISGNNGKLNTDLYRNVKQEYERVHPSARREEINYIPKMPTPSRVRRY